jgi:hypothetical protein
MRTSSIPYNAWCSEISAQIERACPNSVKQTGIGISSCSISIVSPDNPRGDIVEIENWNWKITFYYTRGQDDAGLYTDRFNPVTISSPLDVTWMPPTLKEWFVFNMDKFIGGADEHGEI